MFRIIFLRNGLMLNSKKTQCIFIGNIQLLTRLPLNTDIKLDDEIIIPTSYVKNLGVNFDRYMLFGRHVNEVTRKAVGTLMYINRVRASLDKPSRIIVVQTPVPHIRRQEFIMMRTPNITIINDVQKLQNFATKVATGGIKKYRHITPALKELGWLKVNEKHLFDTCSLVYKVINRFYTPWL